MTCRGRRAWLDAGDAHARSVGEVPGGDAQRLGQRHVEDGAPALDALPGVGERWVGGSVWVGGRIFFEGAKFLGHPLS